MSDLIVLRNPSAGTGAQLDAYAGLLLIALRITVCSSAELIVKAN
jgi:hypothetical protein